MGSTDAAPSPIPRTHSDVISTLVSVFDVIGFVMNAESVSRLKALRVLRVLRLIKLLRLMRGARIFKRCKHTHTDPLHAAARSNRRPLHIHQAAEAHARGTHLQAM
jgi:hypothetical protein